MQDRSNLLTEQRLPESMNLDAMSVEEALAVMNAQDAKAVEAVAKVRGDVVKAIKLVVESFKKGGRLFYFGAGTSGRLGVLDASECPPTFRTDPEMVQGVIAGGIEAIFKAKEGAEDSPEHGAELVDEKKIGPNDTVIGIAAGGTTPFVHGALRHAASKGAKTVFLSCVQPVQNEPKVDVVIRPLTGPEILTGSTRLKAGTAQKLVLNQITTLAMVQIGKCYENLMVDLRASNAKLWDRGARIISMIIGLPKDQSMELLKRGDGHVKLAIVMHKRGVDAAEAKKRLDEAGGNMRKAIG
ncbi:MAG TPA: N-acetylmuramic acid 6-phosphate etherase [Tepidisphaeraceae bacterium]|jgi:N-acetylmuramic acid 6-phosphate etherase|nr:N-acetylmuramic acid 6-phosphate etherase [Tepidisphaeraceae bacterium]